MIYSACSPIPAVQVHSAKYLISIGAVAQIPMNVGPEIALVGRSNVGKSSLINRLVNRKNLARTSNTPGKTRTVNYYCINDAFNFVDLPGYGYAKRSYNERQKWAMLIEAYIKNREVLRGFIHLLDSRHDPTDKDLEMVRWLLKTRKPFLLVATKADKLSGSRLKERMNRTRALLPDSQVFDLLSFSALNGLGSEKVWIWIQEILYG